MFKTQKTIPILRKKVLDPIKKPKRYDSTLKIKQGKLFKSQFEFGPKLGEGGLGHVFKGQNKSTGKIFAIKAMKKEELIKKEQVKHVENEKNLLETLNHPFIVNYHGFFQDKKFVYFAMEQVKCGELFDLLKNRF